MASRGPFNAGNPNRKKTHGIGPDGPRTQYSPGGGQLRDRGRPKNRQQRENPKPKRGVTFGQRPRPNRNRPQRHPQPRTRPPINPGMSQVDALAEMQYGPQFRQLESQQRVEQQRGVNMNNWYADYQRQIQQAAQQQAAYTQGFQQAAFQQANQAAATDQGQNAQLLQQQQASAAQRGTTVDPSVAPQMQAGVAARQVSGAAGGNLLAQQGQAQGAYLANRVGVAGAQGIQAQTDSLARSRKVESLSRELLAQEGASKVKTSMDLQQQQHKNALENAAFGLDVKKERNDQTQALRDDRRTAKDQRIDNRRMAADDREQARHNRETESEARAREQRMRSADLADNGKLDGSSGSAGKFTPTQVRSGRKTFRNLVGRVKNNVDPPSSVDPLLARAAVQMADHGGVDPGLARKIKRQYGFMPKARNWRKKALDDSKSGAENLF